MKYSVKIHSVSSPFFSSQVGQFDPYFKGQPFSCWLKLILNLGRNLRSSSPILRDLAWSQAYCLPSYDLGLSSQIQIPALFLKTGYHLVLQWWELQSALFLCPRSSFGIHVQSLDPKGPKFILAIFPTQGIQSLNSSQVLWPYLHSHSWLWKPTSLWIFSYVICPENNCLPQFPPVSVISLWNHALPGLPPNYQL